LIILIMLGEEYKLWTNNLTLEYNILRWLINIFWMDKFGKQLRKRLRGWVISCYMKCVQFKDAENDFWQLEVKRWRQKTNTIVPWHTTSQLINFWTTISLNYCLTLTSWLTNTLG
jgi:hypothetical protein